MCSVEGNNQISVSDMLEFCRYDQFEGYWFYVKNLDSVSCYLNGIKFGTYHIKTGGLDFAPSDIKPEDVSMQKLEEKLQLFHKRPEWAVFDLYDMNAKDITWEEAFSLYNRLIVGAMLSKAFMSNPKENPDVTEEKRAKSCLKWLSSSSDFYTTPASSRFHESFHGGLLIHHLNVAREIVNLSTLPKFKNVPLESALIVSLTHDWCKIGLYESYTRNVKNEESGVWEKVPSYKYKEEGSPFPFGHGFTSQYLASKFFRLSMQESLAIAWHMGAWHASDDQKPDLQHSNERYPLVLMLQFADQLSITKY